MKGTEAIRRAIWMGRPIESIELELGGNCPVQATGSIGLADGKHEIYFRARGEDWSFEVDDEVVLEGHLETGQFTAGWMTVMDALRRIADGLDAHREKARAVADKECPLPKPASEGQEGEG